MTLHDDEEAGPRPAEPRPLPPAGLGGDVEVPATGGRGMREGESGDEESGEERRLSLAGSRLGCGLAAV